MLRKRMFPVVRNGDGGKSWVHISDAVSAIIAAMERGRSGEVYNIVGAPRPRSLSLWFLRLTAPYAAASLSTRLHKKV